MRDTPTGVRHRTATRTYRRSVQSPSSLIFLVLLGVWAAYFVQYWVRRRDHVSTARSVEQFSEAMRVLERRDRLPGTDLSEAAPPSYAVHPGRATRPQVLVKRAVATEPGAAGVTERITQRPDAVAPVVASAPRPSPGRSQPHQGRPPAASATRGRRVRPGRRVRGLLLLAALAELLLIVGLVAFSLLPLWTLAPAVLAVVAAFLFVRSGVRTEQALVLAHRRRQADLARRRAGALVTPRAAGARLSSAPAASARPAVPEAAEVLEAADVVEPAQPVEVAGGSTLAEQGVVGTDSPVVEPVAAQVVEPVEQAYDVMVPIVDEDDIPLTWDPVPVPRPTYTMKAKAKRPEVSPAAVTPDPAPVERESDESGYDERRVAGA
jgi:hypothetical protein